MNVLKPMFKSIGYFWKHSLDFKSTASRSQYFWNLLVNYYISFVLVGLFIATSGALNTFFKYLAIIYFVLMIIPGIAILCRRYVDIGRNYWWGLVYIGIRIVLKIIYFLIIVLENRGYFVSYTDYRTFINMTLVYWKVSATFIIIFLVLGFLNLCFMVLPANHTLKMTKLLKNTNNF